MVQGSAVVVGCVRFTPTGGAEPGITLLTAEFPGLQSHLAKMIGDNDDIKRDGFKTWLLCDKKDCGTDFAKRPS
jgi:hypothetical protein